LTSQIDKQINSYLPVLPSLSNNKPGVPKSSAEADKKSFQQILAEQLNQPIRFSQHAQQRLKSRNISLSAEAMARLSAAVAKAEQKGARDSLVLMDNLALVVSVKNRTVITAVDGENLKENVFTNIDSAVIV